MTRWATFKRALRLLWQGECSHPNCERGVGNFERRIGGLCEAHRDERHEEFRQEIKQADFEHAVSIQEEALRRTLPDAIRRVQEPHDTWTPRCTRCDREVGSLHNDLRYGHCIDCLAEPGVLDEAQGVRPMESEDD